MVLYLQHPFTGDVKKAPVGFSWTMLFLGALVPLFRGDWKHFFIIFFLDWLVVSYFIFPFTYNKLYIKELLQKGYKVKGVVGGTIEYAETKLGLRLEKLDEKDKTSPVKEISPS